MRRCSTCPLLTAPVMRPSSSPERPNSPTARRPRQTCNGTSRLSSWIAHGSAQQARSALSSALGYGIGREADLFRVFTQGAGLWQRVLRLGERRRFGYTSRWPWLESFGRSRWRDLRPASTLLDATSARLCLGVELSPLVQRSDVWNGSFDAVPAAWSGAFGLVV